MLTRLGAADAGDPNLAQMLADLRAPSSPCRISI